MSRRHAYFTYSIRYPLQHQSIAPEQESAYSELSVHLQFMDKLEHEQGALKSQTLALTLRIPEASETPVVSMPSLDKVPQTQLPPTPAPASGSNGQCPSPKLQMPAKVRSIALKPQSALKPLAPFATSSLKSLKVPPHSTTTEQKKTILPCNFCKERKITCGPPPEGSADPTCK